MQFLDITIENCLWFGKNYAYNLDFVPEEKFGWKAAETTKSAAEITKEVLGVHSFVRHLFDPAYLVDENYSTVTSVEEAKQKILETTRDYAQFLGTLNEADTEGTFETPFGPFPKIRLALLPVQEISHHHGQIAFLQTLWGDTESHLHEMDPNYQGG